MPSLLLLLLPCAAAQSPSAAPGPEPVACTAEELSARFPPAWRLPRTDLAGKALPNTLFEERVIRLAQTPFAAADPAAGRPAILLGDLLARAAAAARAGSKEAARKELDLLLKEAEALVPAELWPDVRALLDLRDFVSPKWDPDDGDERAGFWFGPTWELPAELWPGHDGGREVEQCAVFMAADLASIKASESDFSRYEQYVGNDYLRIAPVAASYFFVLPEGDPVSACGTRCAAALAFSVDFRNDLPFPFGSFELRLHYLSCLDESGRPRTWVYSDSEAFHWLAGCDLFEPVFDGAGNFVGTLVIRQAGLDLDGVPDRSAHRQGGMRMALGGLRRDAEAHYRARAGAAFFPPRGSLPLCPVLEPAR